MPSADGLERGLVALAALHAEIDRRVGLLEEIHASRLQCGRGCSTCCLDDLSIARIEAERIRAAHPTLLDREEPHSPGACAFLDEKGACRIYEDRPSVCRSQGLPLRVVFENDREELEERRDICPLNLEGGPPLDSLDEEDCWLIGLHELRLSQLNERVYGEGEERVALRDLFRRDPSE